MARKPIIAGNWKMNMNHVEATGLVQKLAWTLADKEFDSKAVDAVVIPPFTDLRTVQTLIEGDRMPLQLGAQDVSAQDSGAYTGEINADMLAKLNVGYVVVGHSERRQYHAETDELVGAKAKKVIAQGMTPIICVGEGLDVRKEGKHVEYTVAQVRGALDGLTAEQVAGIVIAYEPVWAIGTGEVATPEDAQEVCGAIRNEVRSAFGDEAADNVRIQYGGSVKSGSIRSIMDQPDVDGALVGGASLKAEEFAAIIRFQDLAA